MSVSAQVPYKKYTAAPAATVFPTTFRVVLATDLQVRVNAVVVTTGFTLSALGLPAGLDVTFTAPMVGGEVVELQRIIPKSRATDYQQLGNFDAGVVNSDIDRTWMSIQEVDAEVKRSVRIPASSTGVSLDLPAPTALTYLRWNALANALENVLLANVSLISLSPYAQTFLDAVSAAAARVVLGATSFGAAVFTAVDAAAARLAILAAKAGANSDITSLGGLTSALYATGQCQLTKSGSNLLLLPKGGNTLTVNGRTCTIPDAGVTLAAPATTATLYYIYAVATAGVITSLEASATGHSTDTTAGNKGVEIKTGDATRSLVGMARTVGSAWVDTVTQPFVRSWFNRLPAVSSNFLASNTTTTSVTFVELSSSVRNEFLLWSGEAVLVSSTGESYNSAASAGMAASLGFDGITPEDVYASGQGNAANISIGPLSYSFPKSGLAEGYHYATLLVKVSSGTGTWTGSTVTIARTTINTKIGV